LIKKEIEEKGECIAFVNMGLEEPVEFHITSIVEEDPLNRGEMISHAEIEAANIHMQTCDSDWAPGAPEGKYEFHVDGSGIHCACGWKFEAGDQLKDVDGSAISCPGCGHSLCPECAGHLDVDLGQLKRICRKCGYSE
jgi:hypothetical protein